MLQNKIVLVDNIDDKVTELLKVPIEEGLLGCHLRSCSGWFLASRLRDSFGGGRGGAIAGNIYSIDSARLALSLEILNTGLELLLKRHLLLILTVDDRPDGVPTDDLRAAMIERDVSDLLHALAIDILELLVRVPVEVHRASIQHHGR